MKQHYPKQVYQEKMRAYLDDLRADLDRIEAKLADAQFNIQDNESRKIIDDARDIDDKAVDKLHELQDVEAIEAATWVEIRSQLEETWDDLMTALNALDLDHRDVQDEEKPIEKA